jgi:hypothetical protein
MVHAAILSQSTNMIGLFEIHTFVEASNETITWITPRNSPFAYFVRPHAILSHDPQLPTVSDPVHIRLLAADFMRMNPFGRIYPELLTNAFMRRLPYVVSFWEQFDVVPVYAISPDTNLPWTSTIRCAVTAPAAVDECWPVEAEQELELLLPADATCPITLDGLIAGSAWRTPCGHYFSVALAQALEADPRCPLCRAACRFEDCVGV